MTDAAGPVTAEALFRSLRDSLAAAGIPTPELDANLLIGHAAGITALDRLREPGRPVDPASEAAARDCLRRRLEREPVHRIIGSREFYGLSLKLSEATLVPRPDTEALVDLVLPAVRGAVARTGRCAVLDIGTGSGAIALAILATVPEATATATDVSGPALETALSNARANGLSGRFTAVRSNWFAQIDSRHDVIVSNPPYIRTGEIAGLDAEVRFHDPRIALDGGDDGLSAYRVIAARAAAHLTPEGVVGVEIGHDQNSVVTKLFEDAGYRKIAERQDFSGHDRAILLTK